MQFRILSSTLLIGSLLLAGCGSQEEEIRVYQLSKPEGGDRSIEPTQASMDGAPMASGPTSPASVNPSSNMQTLPGMEAQTQEIQTPNWTVPAAWEELPPTAIRKGNFRIEDESGNIAEITVTAFPGDVGGLEANINRWRQQIGLPPMELSSMGDSLQPITVDEGEAHYVDLTDGASGDLAILGAVIPRDGNTWFVKMVGAPTLLSEQKNNLERYLETIRF